VGRHPSCHLPLEAGFVSSAHALIRWNGQCWDVRDLGSTNGTFVDGRRIPIGSAIHLKAGVELVFGERDESWQLVHDQPPTVLAVPLDGGPPNALASGTIPIPSADEPVATIYCEGDRWLLELDEARTSLRPGQVFPVAGRDWRFECPSGVVATRASGAALESLADVTLVFSVSSDEEHVSMRVDGAHPGQDLGHRGCFYLALVLLRERREQGRAGIAEPAWVDVDDLLKMVPEYTSLSHLNVDICRLRRIIYDAGVHDGARIIERRRGQLRFGTERARILCPGEEGSA
jgi:hypothetical protein